jgi:hypothetical protein
MEKDPTKPDNTGKPQVFILAITGPKGSTAGYRLALQGSGGGVITCPHQKDNPQCSNTCAGWSTFCGIQKAINQGDVDKMIQ